MRIVAFERAKQHRRDEVEPCPLLLHQLQMQIGGRGVVLPLQRIQLAMRVKLEFHAVDVGKILHVDAIDVDAARPSAVGGMMSNTT